MRETGPRGVGSPCCGRVSRDFWQGPLKAGWPRVENQVERREAGRSENSLLLLSRSLSTTMWDPSQRVHVSYHPRKLPSRSCLRRVSWTRTSCGPWRQWRSSTRKSYSATSSLFYESRHFSTQGRTRRVLSANLGARKLRHAQDTTPSLGSGVPAKDAEKTGERKVEHN